MVLVDVAAMVKVKVVSVIMIVVVTGVVKVL